jgi:plastocyanin
MNTATNAAARALSLSTVLLAASLSCTSDRSDPVGPGGGGNNTVVMGASSFSPPSLTIQRNGTVTWSNTSGIVHNVTFNTAGSPAGIPNHSAGSNARTFPTAGTFNYNCTLHEGMNGAILVQP